MAKRGGVEKEILAKELKERFQGEFSAYIY